MFFRRLGLTGVLGLAILPGTLSTSIGASPYIDDPLNVLIGQCQSMKRIIQHESGTDEQILLAHRTLETNYRSIQELRGKVPESQRGDREFQGCIAQLPAAGELVEKAKILERKKLERDAAESQRRHEAAEEYKKAKTLGLDDYMGLVDVYATIREKQIPLEKLPRYLLAVEDNCDKRFTATGLVGDYYIFSVDDSQHCGFGVIHLAMKKSGSISYLEGEPIRGKYFRILGTEQFQKSNGFPVTVVVMEPIEE
jgi:hypothetical protein